MCCAVRSRSVMSNSSPTPELEPARLLSPRDFSGKNTGGGCHFLLQGILLNQGSNPRLLHLLHWQTDNLPPGPPGKPPSAEERHKVEGFRGPESETVNLFFFFQINQIEEVQLAPSIYFLAFSFL